MKKATMQYLLDMMNYEISTNGGEQNTAKEYVSVRDEIKAELNRGAEEKAAKAAEYEAAWPAVRDALSIAPEITVADIFNECEKELPAGFSKSKIQYGLGHTWADKVVKIEGKPNRYSLRV